MSSISSISKSVHGSGIIQAIFTFPLATAHFYAFTVANFIWRQPHEEEEENESEKKSNELEDEDSSSS